MPKNSSMRTPADKCPLTTSGLLSKADLKRTFLNVGSVPTAEVVLFDDPIYRNGWAIF
jgi:hypothetical protein